MCEREMFLGMTLQLVMYLSPISSIFFFNVRFLFFTFLLLNVFIFAINDTLFGIALRRKHPMRPSPKKMEMA